LGGFHAIQKSAPVTLRLVSPRVAPPFAASQACFLADVVATAALVEGDKAACALSWRMKQPVALA